MPPIPGRLIAYGRSVDSWASIKRFLYLAEGATASVAVTEGIAGARQFHIAGKVEASDMDVDMRLERMLGHIPALVHPHPRSVLIVGVGAGVTAGALAIHPEVERIVICEIEPMVPTSARQFFGDENHHVFDDPRVQLIFDDARHFLQTTNETLRHHHVGSDSSVGPRRRHAVFARVPATGPRASQSRRRGHAVDPAVRDQRRVGQERDRHLRPGVSRYDALES